MVNSLLITQNVFKCHKNRPDPIENTAEPEIYEISHAALAQYAFCIYIYIHTQKIVGSDGT